MWYSWSVCIAIEITCFRNGDTECGTVTLFIINQLSDVRKIKRERVCVCVQG